MLLQAVGLKMRHFIWVCAVCRPNADETDLQLKKEQIYQR